MEKQKVTIIAITNWERDEYEIVASSGHMSDGDIMRLELEEYETKVENENWPGIPFRCEAVNAEDAIDQYNQANCRFDYYKATEAEFE